MKLTSDASEFNSREMTSSDFQKKASDTFAATLRERAFKHRGMKFGRHFAEASGTQFSSKGADTNQNYHRVMAILGETRYFDFEAFVTKHGLAAET